MVDVRLRFNEAKATQAAARILMLRGGKMSYMKLIKLLYLVDREALLRWGRPVTRDSYVCMNKGMVLSRTLDLITEGNEPGAESFWSRYISPPEKYEVELLVQEPPNDELSRAEEELIDEIFRLHGTKNRWELVRFVHTLPEWRDPNGSAIPIEYAQILEASGRSRSEVAGVTEELESLALAEALLHSA